MNRLGLGVIGVPTQDTRATANGLGERLAAPDREEKPNDAVLFDLAAEWAPDEPTRRRLLEALCGFPKSS